MNEFDNLPSLLRKVDDYELEENGTLLKPEECAIKVERLLGVKGLNRLHKDTHPKSGKNIKNRVLFLNYLNKRINENKIPSSNAGETITLEQLLGKKGRELFRKALEEEYKSPNFRNAVFLKSVNLYPGPKWKRRMILWVGGPSASGKSYATQAAIKAVSERLPTDSQEKTQNIVVSIDGGIEREISQMNQLVLQVSLSKGYKGIQDLHQDGLLARGKDIVKNRSKIKKYIQSATLTASTLSLAIPNTFTSGNISGRTKRQIIRFDKIPNCVQIFSEVVTDKSSVLRMGNSRAWGKYKGDIKINNRDIGCESKEYKASSFSKGKAATAEARKIYMDNSKDCFHLTIINDLIFVKVVGKELVKCTPSDPEGTAFKTTQRAFDAWQTLNPKKEDPIKWLASCKEQERLKKLYFEPIINMTFNVAKKVSGKDELMFDSPIGKPLNRQNFKHSSRTFGSTFRTKPITLHHAISHKALDSVTRKPSLKEKILKSCHIKTIQDNFIEVGLRQGCKWTAKDISPTSFNIYENNKSIFNLKLSPQEIEYNLSSNLSDKQRFAFLKGTILNNHHPLIMSEGNPKEIIAILEDTIKLEKEGYKASIIVSESLLRLFSPDLQTKIKALEQEIEDLKNDKNLEKNSK